MSNVLTQTAHFLKVLMPAKVIQSRLHARVFMKFAEKFGLVYFGYVDQRSDEHRLIRGLTVSAKHHDNNYCVGSFDGYDIAVVERTDTIVHPGKASKHHAWIIMTFDLHTNHDIPHIFVGLHSHSDTFYAQLFTKFAQLSRLPYASVPAFSNRYVVYTELARFALTEQILAKDTLAIIGERFGSTTFEIADGCLYLYSEHQRPGAQLLEAMLANGLWLAAHIDKQAK